MIFAVPRACPAATVIVAIPWATPRTNPVLSTDATEASLDDQAKAAPSTGWPFSSNTLATSRSVSPGAIVSAGGDTVTVPADWVTVTTALPETSPAPADTIALPLPTAVTRPPPSTVATSLSLLDHDTATPTIARPIWSRTSAESCSVCPMAVNTTESGVTSTVVGTGAATVTCARPVTPDEVAVISASPAATPVTRPKSSTRATSVSLDSHSNSAPATAWPLPSTASAERCRVSPSTSVSAAGDTLTELTLWATDTVALPDADPAVAVIVAVPLPAAVTRPEPLTAAIEAALLDQVTAAPAITCPFWSRTSAESCTVSPRAVSWVVAGVTATVVGRGGSGGGVGGSVAPSPQAYAQRVADSVAATQIRIRERLMHPSPSAPEARLWCNLNCGKKWAASSRGRNCDEAHVGAQNSGRSIISAMRSPGIWRTDRRHAAMEKAVADPIPIRNRTSRGGSAGRRRGRGGARNAGAGGAPAGSAAARLGDRIGG